MKRGVLVVMEGIDGTGKSTQARLLASWLVGLRYQVTLSAEPTRGKWGKQLRESASNGRLDAGAELELFEKDRKQHVAEVIEPALESGHVVILDRYYFSSMAYQGIRGVSPIEIRRRSEGFAPVPDLLFILDLEPLRAIDRVMERAKIPNEFERQEDLERAALIFRALGQEPFSRLIPAILSPAEIQLRIRKELMAFMGGDDPIPVSDREYE